MNILSQWIRSYVPGLTLPDRELAEALTLRGIAVEGIYELGPESGSLFEMDITTNRVDAMNHYGIAREAAAIAGLPLAPLDAALPPSQPVTVPVKVSIEAPELCGRFTARSLSQVRIQPSTGIVIERFALLQQKLISNAVDATTSSPSPWAILPMLSTATSWKAALSCAAHALKKSSKRWTASNACSTPRTWSSPMKKRPSGSPASWAAGTR